MGLRRVCSAVRFLGSYPEADPASTGHAQPRQDDKSDAEFVDAAEWLARIRSASSAP
jgi:prephenate dehydratase